MKKIVGAVWKLPAKWLPGFFFSFYYRTRLIITQGLYIFYPIFEDLFFVFKEVFSQNSVLMYG